MLFAIDPILLRFFAKQFSEIEAKMSPFCTVWKLREFSLTLFWRKFREINGFTKQVTKELISRNILLVRENFSFYHTALFCKNFVKLTVL